MEKGAVSASAIISSLISQFGIKFVVGSPGSRNMPLLAAFRLNDNLKLKMVIDERSAAFNALGISSIDGSPVAVCCTSGSALLNYAPAVSEAYYRRVPLLVISADRPRDCLNQGEPQTIDQLAALDSITAGVFNVDPYDSQSVVERKVNEALWLLLKTSRPVHLNVCISEPFFAPDYSQVKRTYRLIEPVVLNNTISKESIRHIGQKLSGKKILIYVGQHLPDKILISAIARLSEMAGVVVAAESISNLHGCKNVIYGLESAFKRLTIQELTALCPDLILMIGGTPTGRSFRNYVENFFIGELWRIGKEEEQNDLFQKCTKRIIADSSTFLKRIASVLRPTHQTDIFNNVWKRAAQQTIQPKGAKLISDILSHIPQRCNIELSNGLTVRYASLLPPSHHRYSANRGVNGIDGSTSVAIGASAAYSGLTVLITGDMSAFYDVSAYFSPLVSPRFRAIVIANNGGGIFRKIIPTIGYEHREEILCCGEQIFDLGKIAESANFEVKRLPNQNEESLTEAVAWLSDARSSYPRMLIINTEDS